MTIYTAKLMDSATRKPFTLISTNKSKLKKQLKKYNSSARITKWDKRFHGVIAV